MEYPVEEVVEGVAFLVLPPPDYGVFSGPGLYMFSQQNRMLAFRSILYVGQADDLDTRPGPGHEKWDRP